MPKRDTVVGLDIGRHGIKAAWATRRQGRVVVTRTEVLHLPLSETNPERLVRPWLEKTGIARLPVALGVPGRECVFQSFLLQKEDPRSDAQAAAMEVAKFNEIASTGMAHGYTATTLNERRRLLVIMTRPTVLDTILGYGETMRLNPVELTPSPVALLNLLVEAQPQATGPRLLVNVGHGHTEVAFGSTQGLYFARSFKIGGEAFTAALRAGNAMSAGQADTFKITQTGLDGADAETAAKLQTVAEIWLGEIKTCLAAYRNQVREAELAPERIVLCGGGSLLHGLQAALQTAVGLPVDNAEAAFGRLLPNKPAHVALAAGLGIGALRRGVVHMSLLPEYVRHELVFREKKPYWIASGIAVALTVGVFIVGGIRAISRQSAQLRAAERTVKELGKMTARIEKQEATIAALQKQSAPVLELLHMGPRYRALITAVAEALDPGDWISMISDEFSYYEPAPQEAEAAKRRAARPGMRDTRIAAKPDKEPIFPPVPPLPKRFVVEGYTPKANLMTVKDLIGRLKEASDLIASADLIYDDQKVAGERFLPWATNTTHRHFVILLEVQP
jgi:Tfp pilus assembly PilM family ATPase